MIEAFVAGAGLAYVTIDVVRAVRRARQYRRARRYAHVHLWWYKWHLLWACIGMTELLRTRAEPDSATREDLDKAAGAGEPGPVFMRHASNTCSPETPVWNPEWGRWEESDEQLRQRIDRTLARRGH